MTDFQPVKGMRDFLPEEMQKRQFVLDLIRQVFRRWGYQEMDTPALESFDLLAAKGGGGEEIKKEIYYFKDQANRELGLRFDLTVPMCRVIANKKDLSMPFKRFQFGKVWRYDNPQAGRYREFMQTDIDIIGSGKPESDAEIVAVACDVFNTLGFEDFVIKINNKKISEGFVKALGVKDYMDVFRSVDKFDKIGRDGVEKELMEKVGDKNKVKEILDFIKLSGKPKDILNKLKEKVVGNKTGRDGLKELKDVIEKISLFGFDQNVWIDSSLIRGLEYYTGTVFEVAVSGGKWSLAGGGRYDNMIEQFGGRSTPAIGISLGFERIMLIMEQEDLFRLDNPVKIFVVAINDNVRNETIEVCQRFRREGISADLDLSGKNLSGQLKYVNSRRIPWVVFVGERELKENKVKLRDMSCGEERLIGLTELVTEFKKASKQ